MEASPPPYNPQTAQDPAYQHAPGTEYGGGPPPGAPGYYPPQPQPAGYPPMQGYPPQGQPQYDSRAMPVQNGYGAPAPQVVVVHQHKKDKKRKEEWVPMVIFIVGWFFCPVWCAGWCFLSKKKYGRTGRIFGVLSGTCAVVNAIWIAIVIGVTIAAAAKTVKEVNNAFGPSSPLYSPIYSSPSYYAPLYSPTYYSPTYNTPT